MESLFSMGRLWFITVPMREFLDITNRVTERQRQGYVSDSNTKVSNTFFFSAPSVASWSLTVESSPLFRSRLELALSRSESLLNTSLA